MNDAEATPVVVDERFRAAVLYDRPALRGFGEDAGCRQWLHALRIEVTDFGEIVDGDVVSLAAHIVHRTTIGEPTGLPDLRATLAGEGPAGELFEGLIGLGLLIDDHERDVASLRETFELVRRLADTDLRARLSLRLSAFARVRGEREPARAAVQLAVTETTATTRLGTVARRWAHSHGVEVANFDPFVSTSTPDDPLLTLPWVQQEALDAAAGLATERFDQQLAGMWDSSFRFGRTKVDDLLAAHLQAEWCGAFDLRSTIRKVLSAHLLTGGARSAEETRWALFIWASESKKRRSAAIRRAEASLDAASAAELLDAVRDDPAIDYETAVDVAIGVWDLLDDQDSDVLLSWIVAQAPRPDDRRAGALIGNLRWRRPRTWQSIFADARGPTRTRMLTGIGPGDFDEMSPELRNLIARHIASVAPGEVSPKVLAALQVLTSGPQALDVEGLDAGAALELLSWRSDAIPETALSEIVGRLVEQTLDRLTEAEAGTFGVGDDTGQLVGSLAGYLPNRDPRVVEALLRTCRSELVPANWQLGGLEGLAALRRSDHLSSADLEEIRGLELRPGPAFFEESLSASVLRADQLRVLAPALDDDEIAWLAICSRGNDRQARLVAIATLGAVTDAATSTVDWSLVGGLFDPDDQVVLRAVAAVARRGFVGDSGAIPVARHRFEDLARAGSPKVRRGVVLAAAERPELDLGKIITGARTDPAWTVRSEAERSVDSLNE